MNFFINLLIGYKRPISSPENARTNNPAAILEGFRRKTRLPVSTGLSPLLTWHHSSMLFVQGFLRLG